MSTQPSEVSCRGCRKRWQAARGITVEDLRKVEEAPDDLQVIDRTSKLVIACQRLRSWRYRYDDDCMSDLGEGRCKHGEIADWCGECVPARKGLPARVWRTAQGEVYHRKPTCEALQDGQRKMRRFGRQVSTPERVPLSVAMGEGLAECFHCFPPDVPPDAKPCQVLVAGRWIDGFLLEWQRGPDNRWKGRVNYRWEAGRQVTLKDQTQLRPDVDVTP